MLNAALSSGVHVPSWATRRVLLATLDAANPSLTDLSRTLTWVEVEARGTASCGAEINRYSTARLLHLRNNVMTFRHSAIVSNDLRAQCSGEPGRHRGEVTGKCGVRREVM